jgi:protein translocase SecG subunit
VFESIQFAALIGIWFLCPVLIALILLQGGGDVGSAFGGGGQLDSSLGVGAVRKISKITGWLSLLFMLCVVLVAIRGDGPQIDALTPAVPPTDEPPATGSTTGADTTLPPTDDNLPTLEVSAEAAAEVVAPAEAPADDAVAPATDETLPVLETE